MSDHDDLPVISPYVRQLAAQIRTNVETAGIAHRGRLFWRLTNRADGTLAWMAFTTPDARPALDRRKVWTLLPRQRIFIANWFVMVDRDEPDQSRWVHTAIDIDEARDLALEVPQPAVEDIKRITRPEAMLTLDQVDRRSVVTVLGKRVDTSLARRK
jgi:hypothetical protein